MCAGYVLPLLYQILKVMKSKVKTNELKDIQMYEFVKGNVEEDLSKSDIKEMFNTKFPGVSDKNFNELYSLAFALEMEFNFTNN